MFQHTTAKNIWQKAKTRKPLTNIALLKKNTFGIVIALN